MSRTEQWLAKNHRLLLVSSWLVYMVFTVFCHPIFGDSVMLPSILLCGFATWQYSTRAGLLTALATLLYHMLMLTYNSIDWSVAWNPGGLSAQLFAIACISKAKSTHERTIKLNNELERRIRERTAELKEISEYMENRAASEYLKISQQLQKVATNQLETLLRHSETLRNLLTYNNGPYVASATKLVEIAQENIEQIGNIRRRLSPESIMETGIEQAVQEMCKYLNKATGTRFSVVVQYSKQGAMENALFTIYRIVHEAVTNALRHGKAKKVDIRLSIGENSFDLEIVNDGIPWRGITSEGIGIQLMRQQAERLGATVQYTTDASSERTVLRCATTHQKT